MKGNSPLFGKPKRPKLPNGLTRSQINRIQNGYKKIDDHLTDKDIEGAIREINGDPIRDKYGNPFQHYKEVDDAINGLRKDRDSLKKSIQNPNLSPEIKKYISEVIKEFDIKIQDWERVRK